MILELGLAKVIAAGGGLVSSIALIAGIAGGGHYAAAKAEPGRLKSAVCAYTDKKSSHSLKTSRLSARLGLTPAQVRNARTIIETAEKLELPPRAAVIGLATAWQESGLSSAAVGDHGQAFGIFQQHPQYGWGTRAQVSTATYASKAFFARLAHIESWTRKPLTVVAQAIQRSASPNAYAKHETRAKRLFAALTRSGAPKKPTDTVRLSPEDFRAVRNSLEMATALGVSRATVVADIQEALNAGKLPSVPRTGKTSDLAEKVFTTVAEKLCQELTQRIDESLDPAALAALQTSGRGSVALAAAFKMIGVPYSWGGGGPDGPSYGTAQGAGINGFDCSGLSEYAWAKAGVRIGSDTSAQWRAGVRVRRSQLKPGDLIFFATNPKDPSTIHHVVMNIDGRRYIHAPSTGSRVRVDTWTSYREAEYAGAVRPG
ncbi:MULTISPECIES: C40 family peptidase [unclassified Nonomuraea]|uniref:C40 family peptidase n=1 Tax=unclassified Nonomuraea TaxID=2593643 RepID=UPI0033E278FF